jgi:hypothetical protein
MLMLNFTEKQKKYAKYCEQFKTVNDLSHSLKKIQRSIDEIIPMMKVKNLNSYFLPNLYYKMYFL